MEDSRCHSYLQAGQEERFRKLYTDDRHSFTLISETTIEKLVVLQIVYKYLKKS